MKKDWKVVDDEIVITRETSIVTKRYSLEFSLGQLENIDKEIAEYTGRLADANTRREYRSEIVDHVTPLIEAKKEAARLEEEAKAKESEVIEGE